MKPGLRTGIRHSVTKAIQPEQTITFEGLPPVFATPFLVWALEETAMLLLEPYLDEDEMTLGTQVDVEHLGISLIGDEVAFTAVVVQTNGREFLFQVEAKMGETLIAKGLHRRRRVSKSKLQRRLSRID